MRLRLAGGRGAGRTGCSAITIARAFQAAAGGTMPASPHVAAMLLLTLRATPTIYQGEEIGMEDVPIATQAARDPWEKNVPGLGLGRDPERTPMQWDESQ